MKNDGTAFPQHADDVLFSRNLNPTLAVSPDVESRTRKNYSLILNHLSAAKQSHVADSLGIHESTISKWKENGELERMARFLAVIDLQVAAKDDRLYKPAEIEAAFILLRGQMNNAGGAEEFFLAP